MRALFLWLFGLAVIVVCVWLIASDDDGMARCELNYSHDICVTTLQR